MIESDIAAAVAFLRKRESESERVQEYLEGYDSDERLAADIRRYVPEKQLPEARPEEVATGEGHPTVRIKWQRLVVAALKIACLYMVLRRAADVGASGRLDPKSVKEKLQERYPEVMVLGLEIVNEILEAFAD